jgi:hypothetical protein
VKIQPQWVVTPGKQTNMALVYLSIPVNVFVLDKTVAFY